MARGATVRFRPNPGFEAEIARETVDVPRAAARDAADNARASAPRGPSGRYAESIKVQDEPDGATLYTDDFAGHLVEWGSINNRAYRTLSNAALQTGADVELL
jgi:hypothetical protein